MKMDVGRAITSIVEAVLPAGTQGKVLHVCVEVNYCCLPRADKNPNDIRDEFNCRTFVHYVFHRYRPDSYTRVLRKEGLSQYLDRENGKIFHMISWHDNTWSDVVTQDLWEIHERILKDIEKKYTEITGNEMPHTKRLMQPSYCDLKVKLLDGEVSGHGYENRKYRLRMKDGKTNFIQEKEKK